MLWFFLAVAIWLVQAVWGFRLWKLKLVGRYPALFAFLVTSTVLGVAIQVLSGLFNSFGNSHFYIYRWAWVAIKPVESILLFCVLAEMYSRMVEEYHGLHRLGQWFIWTASGIAAVLFLAMSVLGASAEQWLEFWNLQEGSIYTALSVFSLLVISFAVHFRLRIPLNLRIVFAVFAVTVTCSVVLRALDDLGWLGSSVGGTQLNSIRWVSG